MIASHLVEVNELSATQLCQYIEDKHYVPITQSLESIMKKASGYENQVSEAEQQGVVLLLFTRLKEEVEQVLRNDTLLVFPLIAQREAAGNLLHSRLPMEMIREKNHKIIQLLDKLKTLANHYILKDDWDTGTRLFFEELFGLNQMITQAIYLKENVLLPKIFKTA